MKTLLKNGTVLDYASDTNEVMDILINGSKIEKIGKDLEVQADRVIDCTNLSIMPGMIDMHCHLREPGFEYKETIETGSKSAVKGGYTSICPMPNTKPTPDSAFVLQKIIDEAKRVNLCNVFPYSSVTKGELGEELVDFQEQKSAGAIAFSDDGIPVVNSRIMRQGIINADKLGTFVASHCEEKSVASGAINAGEVADKLGVEGVLPEAEEIMAAREIVISETNDVRAHICHISTKTSVNMIRDAKKRGVKITCETCPHYYSFTQDEVLVSGTNAKMNPPLRTEVDKQAIIQGLKDGTIDAIITDHAPHSAEEKSKGLAGSAMGVVGLEVCFPVLYTNLVKPGIITLEKLLELMNTNATKIFGIGSELKVGAPADLTVYDLNEEYDIDSSTFVSMGKATPFDGNHVFGRCKLTICDGKEVWNILK